MDRHFPAYDTPDADSPWSAPAHTGPVIVHKRRRLPGLLPSEAAARAATPADDAPRGPRVFTLRPAATVRATAEAGGETAAEAEAEALPARPRRRRDAAHRPGEVTRIVITPPAEEAAAEAAVPAPAPAPEGGAFARVNAELDGLMQDVKRHAYFAHLKFF